MKAYLVDCMQKQVPASFEGYKAYVQSAIANNKQLTLSAKAATKALAIAGNMIAMWAITAAVKLLAQVLDNAADSFEDVEARIQDNQTALSDYTSKIEELTSKLEELNQTDVTYLSDNEKQKLETDKKYIQSEIDLYNRLIEAKQKAANQDSIKAAMGKNEEVAIKKLWSELTSGDWEGMDKTSREINGKKNFLDIINPISGLTTLFKNVDDGNYFSEADKLFEEYRQLQDKYAGLENLAIYSNNELLTEKIDETSFKMNQTAADIAAYIEKIAEARDALIESPNKDDYADEIAEMTEVIEKYQGVLNGTIYESEYAGSTDLQRDLLGLRDAFNAVTGSVGLENLEIFDSVNKLMDHLIGIIGVLNTYSLPEIFELSKIPLTEAFNDLKTKFLNGEIFDAVKNKLSNAIVSELTKPWKKLKITVEKVSEIFDSAKNKLSDVIPPELIENWEKLKITVEKIGEIFDAVRDKLSDTGIFNTYSLPEIFELDKIPLTEAFNDLKTVFEILETKFLNGEIFDAAKNRLNDVIPPELTELWEKLKTTFGNIGEIFDAVNDKLSNILPPELIENWEKIKTIWEEAGAKLKEFISYISDETNITAILDTLREKIIDMLSPFLFFIDKYNEFLGIAKAAWDKAHSFEYSDPTRDDSKTSGETQSPISKPISFTGFNEYQSKSIDGFQSKVKTLGDTLSSLKSGKDIGLTDLIQEFPELTGQTDNLEQAITDLIYSSLLKLYDTLGEGLPDNLKDDLQSIADTAAGVTPELDTAFSAIQKSYDVLHDFEDAMSGSMTDDVLSSVGSLSPKLNALAAGFYAGTVGADELYDALTEHYETDMENYANALVAKNKLSGDFYNSIVLEDTEFVNTFKDNYGIDLTNYKSYHEAKLNIAIGTIKALGENWSRYYDALTFALTADGKRLLSTLSQSSSEASHKKYAEIMSQIGQFKQAMNVLDNVIYNGVEANFSSISSTFEKTSRETSDTAKEIEDTAKDQIDSYLNYMKSSLEAGRTDYRTYARDVSAFLRNMFDGGKISAQEYHDYVGQMLETQKSILDRVTDAVTDRLDREIDSLKDKMDEIEENYNSQIEYLDTVIEYHEKQKEILQDENDELDRQKALEEALYSLQRAQNQRTIALYTAGKGKIYVTDASAVRDAEDSARKAKLDMELAKIDEAIEKVEKQQDALKEAMDTEKEQLQAVIDRLEEYKKQWSSVASEYEDIQNDMLAKQVLGADYESKILDGRLDVLSSFRDEYLSIQKAITDAALESAKAQLEASQSVQNTSSSATPESDPPKAPPEPAKKWYIYEEYEIKNENGIKTGKTYSKEWAGPYATQSEAAKDLSRYAALAPSHQVTLKNKYASGTRHARKGLNLVGEEGTETYIDNDGNVSLVTAPSLISMEGGETVKNAEETKALFDSTNLIPADTMASAGIKGKTIPFTMEELRHRIQNALPAFSGMVQPDIQLPVCNFTSVQNTTPVVQNITLTLPNVTNTSGYERIKNELKQMQIDAYQAAHRK